MESREHILGSLGVWVCRKLGSRLEKGKAGEGDTWIPRVRGVLGPQRAVARVLLVILLKFCFGRGAAHRLGEPRTSFRPGYLCLQESGR